MYTWDPTVHNKIFIEKTGFKVLNGLCLGHIHTKSGTVAISAGFCVGVGVSLQPLFHLHS